MSPIGPASPVGSAGITRWYSAVEDVVYIGLGVLLTGIVTVLLVGTFISYGRSALAWQMAANVTGLLDQVLLILLLVELLYTVQLSLREHALTAEPFLLVGLISVIRRVLVLTAVMGEKHQRGEIATQGLVSELGVLAALILALAVALMLSRRHRAPPSSVHD